MKRTLLLLILLGSSAVAVTVLAGQAPGNFSPLYRGQLLVHGMGFSPDHKTLVVVSIGSNSVTFIDTATNAVKHTTYVGRSPHEAFFTPDGKEVWVTVRGENYVAVLDSQTFIGPIRQLVQPDTAEQRRFLVVMRGTPQAIGSVVQFQTP
jgi:YVTN family beta-propeller protein